MTLQMDAGGGAEASFAIETEDGPVAPMIRTRRRARARTLPCAEDAAATERTRGARGDDDGAEHHDVIEHAHGPVVTYADDATRGLHHLADSLVAYQKLRKAEQQRGVLPAFLAPLEKVEALAAAKLTKALRAHPLWPWLAQFPGLGGVHTASFMGRMRDPRRFLKPGGKGARSLWCYAGLHVVNGVLPRNRRGVKSSWNPKMRLAVLQPGGIAEQIVRLRVPGYRAIYDAAKVRIAMERGVVDTPTAVDEHPGDPVPIEEKPAPAQRSGGRGKGKRGRAGAHSASEACSGVTRAERTVDRPLEAESVGGGPLPPLTPIQIEKRARIIAAKAFVADLWRAWLHVLPAAEKGDAIERRTGGSK